EVGRDGEGARRARAGLRRERGGPHRARTCTSRALQVPHVGRVPGRAGAHRHRKAPEVQAPRAVLGGPRQPGRLTVPDGPTVSRVVGQLRYLFEERPERPGAPAAELARWLSREDRMARARAADPLGSRERVEAAANGLDDRITDSMVAQALAQLRRSDR